MTPNARRMRILVLAISLFVVSVSRAQAQDTIPTAARILIEYDAQRKSALLAGVLELYTVPLVGYAYAGNWRAGLWPAGLYLGGVAMMAAGCMFEAAADCSNDEQEILAAGLTLVFASRIWGTIGAVRTVHAHNRDLRVRLLIEPARSPDSFALHLGLRVPMQVSMTPR